MAHTEKRRKIDLKAEAEMEADSTLNYPEKVYTKIFEYLEADEDQKTLASVSLCNRALYKLTKSYFEKECTINIFIKKEELIENFKNLSRNYKSFKIVHLDDSKESDFKTLMTKFGQHVEKMEFVFGRLTAAKFCGIIQMMSSLKSLVFRHFSFEGEIGSLRVRQNLEELTLDGLTNPPMELFGNCVNLQEFVYASFFECDRRENSLEAFFTNQRSLKRLAIDEDLLFSAQIQNNIKFQLENLTYSFVVHKRWDPTLLFLHTQRNIEILNVEAKNWRESYDPDVYMEDHLAFIFSLTKLKILYFDHMGCEQLKIRPQILKKAKENLNLKTLVMKNDVDGTIGQIFNVFLKTCPNIELLAFCFTKKLPMQGFVNINKLQKLTKMHINRCGNPAFKLSKLVIGDKLKNFTYGGKDLKLIEYKKFFKNHPKLAHVTLYIAKMKNKVADLVQALLVLTELRTLTLHVKDFPEALKDLIKSNLKYLYSFSVQDPATDPDEEDSEDDDNYNGDDE